MVHNPIARIRAKDMYVQISVDENGDFQWESAIIADIDPDAPALDVAAVFGPHDIKVRWFEGKEFPTVTVNDMTPSSGGTSEGAQEDGK